MYLLIVYGWKIYFCFCVNCINFFVNNWKFGCNLFVFLCFVLEIGLVSGVLYKIVFGILGVIFVNNEIELWLNDENII